MSNTVSQQDQERALAERFEVLRGEQIHHSYCQNKGICNSQEFPEWDCHGKGWTPHVTLEGVLEAAKKAGYCIEMNNTNPDAPIGQQWEFRLSTWDYSEFESYGRAATPLGAAVSALASAVTGKEEG